MKNIIIILFLPLTIFSQEKIGSYEIFGKELNIQVTEPNDKGYTLYLDGYPLDKIVSKGGLMIESKKVDDFKNACNEAKEKYIEWTSTAKENNVTDLRKDIKVKIPKLEGYFSYGDWNFDFNVSPYFVYLITKDKKSGKVSYGLALYTGGMQASDNEYIDTDSFCYGFYTLEDIENFISLLDSKLVYDHFGSKNSKEDLFKD